MVLELTDEGSQVCIRFIENVLKYIITKLILLSDYYMKIGYLRQGDGIFDEFFVELFSLLIICMIDTTLKDATAMLMSGNFNTIHSNSIINELL